MEMVFYISWAIGFIVLALYCNKKVEAAVTYFKQEIEAFKGKIEALEQKIEDEVKKI